MRYLLTIFLTVCALPLLAADQRVTLRIAVTNLPVTGNNLNFTAHAAKTLIWSNTTTATFVATNTTVNGCATNLFLQMAGYALWTPRPALQWVNTNTFDIIGEVNQNIAATNSGTWATLTLSTQGVTKMYTVRLPLASETGDTNRTNIGSLLVLGITDFSTNAFGSNSTAMTHFLGLNTNAQRALGRKRFDQLDTSTNITTIYGGTNSGTRIEAATYVSAASGSITNFYQTNSVLDKPTLTNAIVYKGISSPGTNAAGSITTSEQFGSGAFATNTGSLAVGLNAKARGVQSTALGNESEAGKDYGTAVGQGAFAGENAFAGGAEANASGTNSFAVGASATSAFTDAGAIGPNATATTNNQLFVGGSIYLIETTARIKAGSLTNAFLTGTNSNNGDWSDAMTTDNTLANGDNTPSFSGRVVRWTAGPSAAFQISGFTGQPRDGQEIDRINLTGQAMTINHESGTTGATNRINTLRGTNVVCNTNAYAVFKYSAQDSRWLLKSLQPGSP